MKLLVMSLFALFSTGVFALSNAGATSSTPASGGVYDGVCFLVEKMEDGTPVLAPLPLSSSLSLGAGPEEVYADATLRIQFTTEIIRQDGEVILTLTLLQDDEVLQQVSKPYFETSGDEILRLNDLWQDYPEYPALSCGYDE